MLKVMCVVLGRVGTFMLDQATRQLGRGCVLFSFNSADPVETGVVLIVLSDRSESCGSLPVCECTASLCS